MKSLTKPTIIVFLTIVLIVSGLTVFGETKKEMKIIVHEKEEMKQIESNIPGIMHDKEFGMHMLLNLTNEQEKKIHEMKIALMKDMIDIKAKIEKADIDFNELISNNANLKTLIKKMEHIGKMKMDIEKKKIEVFVKTREMLSEEQKEIMNKIGVNLFDNEHRMMMKKFIMDGKDMKFKGMDGEGKHLYKNQNNCDDCDDCDEGK